MRFGKREIKNILITSEWTILLSGVILWAFYSGHSYSLEALSTYGPAFMLDDLVIVFAVSVFAGLILVDLESIVFGSVGVLGSSVVIVFLCINLPSFLGMIEYPALREYLQVAAVNFIFRSFMLSGVICLMGALLGGFLGERMRLKD